jgi:hypothetical protein
MAPSAPSEAVIMVAHIHAISEMTCQSKFTPWRE